MKAIRKNSMMIIFAVIGVLLIIGVGVMITKTNREYFDGADAKIVMYFTNWCGHCKTTKPEFKKLGSSQKVNGKTVAVEMIDGDVNKAAVKKAGVKGYPTIHLIHKNGQVTEFQGNRKATNFKKFLKDHVK